MALRGRAITLGAASNLTGESSFVMQRTSTFSFDVSEHGRYAIQVSSRAGGGRSKAFICAVRFYADDGQKCLWLTEGQAFSDKYGEFFYVHGGVSGTPRVSSHTVFAAPEATKMVLHIVPWNCSPARGFTPEDVTVVRVEDGVEVPERRAKWLEYKSRFPAQRASMGKQVVRQLEQALREDRRYQLCVSMLEQPTSSSSTAEVRLTYFRRSGAGQEGRGGRFELLREDVVEAPLTAPGVVDEATAEVSVSVADEPGDGAEYKVRAIVNDGGYQVVNWLDLRDVTDDVEPEPASANDGALGEEPAAETTAAVEGPAAEAEVPEAESAAHEFTGFDPQNYLSVKAEILSGVRDDERSFIATFKAYNSKGAEIEEKIEGLAHSQKWGCYSYLRGGSEAEPFVFSRGFFPPTSAAKLCVEVQNWNFRDAPPVVRNLEWSEHAPIEQQVAEIRNEFETFYGKWSKDNRPFVVITSTTKPIGFQGRLNRPQMIAKSLADLGVMVCYVYYRFHQGDPVSAPYPLSTKSPLIQIPSDIFFQLSGEITKFHQGGQRAYIASIPDRDNASEIGRLRFRGWKTAYEARDDWEEFKKEGVGNWYQPVWERFLCEHADVKFAVSPFLADKLNLMGGASKTVLSPNGTTSEFIALAQPFRKKRKAAAEAGGNGKPKSRKRTIGYFGHLTESWFDWPLIVAAAARMPDVTFDLIGFGAPENLEAPDNVVLRGAIDHSALPAATEDWDVAMIPFRPGALALAVDPIKVYEYLALGLCTVAVPMGRLDQLPMTHVYETEVQFDECLDKVFATQSTEQEWADAESMLTRCTWESRSLQMLNALDIVI